MADDQDTPEVAALTSRINSWLDKLNNRIEIDLRNKPLNFRPITEDLFGTDEDQASITIGFKDGCPTKNSSVAEFRDKFNFLAFDRLPCPGLEGVPSQWIIYPQTPMSSFSEGVTIEQYDPNTQVLSMEIQTNFFAIYGKVPQKYPIADAASPKGTYLQVRRDIQGVVHLRAKLVFNQ